MREDKITNIIRGDRLISEFMRRMFFKKGGHQNHRKNEIRNNARLLQQLRKRKGKESCNLLSCIDHANYRDIIDAIRQVAGSVRNFSNMPHPNLRENWDCM